MLKKVLFTSALALGLSAAPASAAVIFSDNFNTENGGTPMLNYAGFANFTISDGSVDLIGSGPGGTSFNFLPGNGLYVDLDGSTSDAGLMLQDSIMLGAGNYVFEFDLAGSQRGSTETVQTFLYVNGSPLLGPYVFTRNSADPFSTQSISFSILGGGTVGISFSFQNVGAPGDNVGALLDNVRLSTVPEPGSMLLLAMAGAGFIARRRRAL